MNRRATERAYKRYADYWRHLSQAEYDDFCAFKHRIRVVEARLVRLVGELIRVRVLRKHLRVLEIGCGDGSITSVYIRELAPCYEQLDYTGVDLCPLALASFRRNWLAGLPERAHAELIECNAERLPSNLGVFDVVLSHHSCYGVSVAAIIRWLSLLEDDGLMVVVANADGCIFSQIRAMKGASITSAEQISTGMHDASVSHEIIHWEHRLRASQWECDAESPTLRYLALQGSGVIPETALNAKIGNGRYVDGIIIADG